MKIALYHNVTFGGAERAIFELAKGLSKRHTVDLYKIDIDAKKTDLYGYQKVQDD